MNRIIIFLAIAISLTSCFKERIELDNNKDENKKLVITGWITSFDEPQFISVSRTVNYLGSLVNDKVSGAEVTLQDEVNTYTLVEAEAGNYYLPTNWTARVGDNYQLKVKYEGKDYSATHQMRPCPEIENLTYEVSEEIPEGEEENIYETNFEFQEIPGLGDAYFGIDYLKNSPAKDSLVNGSYVDDEFFDGQYFEDIILSEEDRYFKIGDTAVVEIHSIGVETAKFLQDIESEIYRGGPFDPPPANVRTNILGGAIGYFIVSDISRAEIVIQ